VLLFARARLTIKVMKSKCKPIVVSVLLSAVTINAGAQSSSFKVQVMDALDGKPYNDIPIIYYCDDPAQFKVTRKRTVTDSNGFAVVPYECKDSQKVQISTFIANGETIWAGKVEECGYLQPQDIEQILSVGVISKPTAAGGIWCPVKVSKKMKPIPGQVTIFVKKPTWWQKHVAP
jgi:hypothetical protein